MSAPSPSNTAAPPGNTALPASDPVPLAIDQGPLRFETDPAWTETVLADFDTFLKDHASAEKKASGMAMTMISHYPDRQQLVEVMTELAVEELCHFREVVKLLHARDQRLGADLKDPYVVGLRKVARSGREDFFLDRLLIASAIEARGAERFRLVAEAVPSANLKSFYQEIARSEQRHYAVFLELAYIYYDREATDTRFGELLDIEAEICAALPHRAALH